MHLRVSPALDVAGPPANEHGAACVEAAAGDRHQSAAGSRADVRIDALDINTMQKLVWHGAKKTGVFEQTVIVGAL
jgi:hypothetical protein